MKLSEYLSDKSMAEFATTIGVSVQAVWQYTKGIRNPRHDIAPRIIAATGGAVGYDDLYGRVTIPAGPTTSTTTDRTTGHTPTQEAA